MNSMSDDEYDEELPPITVNSSAAKGNQFIMPSADVIASQRAYEEECEQELRDLRSQYECEEAVTAISHDSSGSEGEVILAAAIESMKVHSSQTASQLDAIELLQKIIANLSDYDTTFLKDYLDVLLKEKEDTIIIVTDNVMSSIEHAIKETVKNGNMLNEQELVVIGLWLCAACLWASPRVSNARRALHVLLTYYTQQQMELFCGTLSGCLESAALVRASDAVSAPLPAATSAAALLLRAALARLAPQHHLENVRGPLRAAELVVVLGGVWRALVAPQQYVALQVAGRVLAESARPEPAPGGSAPQPGGPYPVPDAGDVQRLLALLATPPPQYRYRPDYLKVLMAVSKLQNLFKNYLLD